MMVDANKILNFLDITGNWDPSLLFVMIGAVLAGYCPGPGSTRFRNYGCILFCHRNDRKLLLFFFIALIKKDSKIK